MREKSHKTKGMNILKSVMSAMLVIVMLFTMVGVYVPAETFKADGATTSRVRVKMSDGSCPYIYTWNSSNEPLTGPWPGTQLVQKDDEEYYYCDVPTGGTYNVIFNNNASWQTTDITDVSGNVTYYVNKDTNEVLKIEKKTINVIVVPNEYDEDNLYIYAWDSVGELIETWPGTTLTKDDKTGNYVYTLDKNIAEKFNLIINNGTVQTEDITGISEDVIITLGDITNGKIKAKTEKPASLYGSSIVLGGDIGVVFYYDLADAIKNENTKVEFTLANGKTSTVTYGDASMRTNAEHVGFMCDVNATEMNQEITAKLYHGNTLLDESTYSVKEYCADQLADNSLDAETKAVIESLLLYGAAAQNKFDVDTDNLVTNGFTDLPNLVQLGETEISGLKDEYQLTNDLKDSTAGISLKASSLVLNSKTSMRVYFNFGAEKSQNNYTFDVVNGATGTNVTDNCTWGNNTNGTYLEIPDVGATNLDSMYAITVSASGNTVLEVKYSPFVYIANKCEDERVKDVVTGLYRYNIAVEEYKEKNQ